MSGLDPSLHVCSPGFHVRSACRAAEARHVDLRDLPMYKRALACTLALVPSGAVVCGAHPSGPLSPEDIERMSGS